MPEHMCSSGDACLYKKMYEGSQKSLTDMSSRQSNSLTRLGRFRSGIVSVIRRAFPSEARMAESSMGKRLIDLDDEILLNFIERLTTDAARRDEKLALKAIGSILSNYGFPIDINKPPVEWLSSITSHLQTITPPQPSLSDLFDLPDLTGSSPSPEVSEMSQATKTVTVNPASDLESASNADDQNLLNTESSLADILWDGPAGNPDISSSWSPSPVVAKDYVSPSASPTPSGSVDSLATVFESDDSVVVRPQLFPSTPSKSRRGRKPRVSAEPASPFGGASLSGDLDDDLVQALIAASSIPRPVFTRDLVSITGSVDVVDAWEDLCRSDPSKYPVRFIAPKQRHRLRGSLVVPDSSLRVTVKPSDWWFKCVDSYRASRLYELAVLLHSVGDEVVSFNFSEFAASLRLNSDRGLVGVLVMLDNRIDRSDPAGKVLFSELSSMLSERLTLVSVLTYSGESRDLDLLCDAVSDLALVNNWSVSVPVICGKCWEYAEDRGSNSRIVLGG
jgi:hypothetical protein